MEDRLDLEKVKELYDRIGRDRFEKYISRLGKQSKLYTALESSIGQELLKEAINRSEALLLKIINEDASEVERADFRALKTILNDWAGKIARYIENLNRVV